jgi:membrane protease YdiL (CAAX protease family)
LLVRGFLFGTVFVSFPELLTKLANYRYSPLMRNIVVAIGIASTSILFVTQHSQINTYRYLFSVLVSLLYLWDNQNLIPAMIAHFINNFVFTFVI